MESERRALLAIKFDMYDPDNWFSTWTGKDCCGWRGVACDHTTGHVTKLDLHYPYTYDVRDISDIMETMGWSKVNPSLQELKLLTYLDLSMNNFSHAPVPKMIASLVHLEYLNLSYAMFYGLVPPQLGNLSNLHYLDLQGRYYDDFLHVDNLDWLSRISSLKYLDMSFVNLSKAINWFYVINSISTLEVLHLIYVELPYVPSPLPPFNLTTIATLDLSWNSNITSAMLRWLSNATSFENLLLSDSNKIVGWIPPSIGNLTNLVHLDLSMNNISGYIPDTLAALIHMKELCLSNNRISGQIPQTIGDLQNLWMLFLSNNYISGQIPKTIGKLHYLQYLDMSYNNLSVLKGNNLTGIIPSSMGQLSQLQEVDLSSNSLAGNITEAHFLNLTSLSKLIIASNYLNVMLPNDWRPPFNASIIDMSFCHLRGKFPAWIQTQQQLQSLYLSGVGVSGSLPIWFSNFSKGLEILYLSSNYLTGQLPSAPHLILDLSNNSFDSFILKYCNQLIILDLGENKLFGKIPKWIGRNLSSLKVLSLRSNLLNRVIPENIVNLTSLQVLDLSSNNLFGSLPSSLGNFTAMVEVQNDTRSWFEDYYFYIERILVTTKELIVEEHYSYIESILLTTKGEIAYYTTILSLVTFIDLSNNQLSGEIPKDLTKLLGLRFLNLSNNHLTRRIPENIGDMKTLESLDLSVNSLIGEIPSSFSAMHFLESLNLSYNNLSGKIPTSGQLSTFDSWAYVGNKGLCGMPLPDCPVYQTPPDARDGRIASKRLMMLVALLLVSCCLGHGFGDEDHVEVEGIGSSCMESERRALLAIKSDMYDPGDRFSSWTGKDCCGWRGVACDHTTGHVTKLDLHYSYTYDIGEIPQTVGNFVRLEYLDLRWNQLSGDIPLGSLRDLEYLDLSWNSIVTLHILASLGNLTNLRHLDLGYNLISGEIPPTVGDSVRLEYLDLSNNGINGKIPQAIGNLSNLLELHLSGNKIVGWIPPSIGNLTNLVYLDLSVNKIVGWIPSSIGNLTNLVYLDLSYNNIVGWIPPSIGNLTNLVHLDLSRNNI
ncbi:unnamed protein product, partial [Musa acuminata var. zebrina]